MYCRQKYSQKKIKKAKTNKIQIIAWLCSVAQCVLNHTVQMILVNLCERKYILFHRKALRSWHDKDVAASPELQLNLEGE